MESTIVIGNGKIVWKVAWIKYYLRLNLSSRRYQYPGYLSIHQMYTQNVPKSQNEFKNVQKLKTTVLFIFDQLLQALIHLNFIILISICFSNIYQFLYHSYIKLMMPGVNYVIYGCFFARKSPRILLQEENIVAVIIQDKSRILCTCRLFLLT